MKKQILSILLSVLIVLTSVPGLMIFASADIIKSGKCGANVNYSIDSSGTLTISGSGKMNDYEFSTGTNAPWFHNVNEHGTAYEDVDTKNLIKSVVIENGVTHIGECAFSNGLEDGLPMTSVKIPDSVTSIGKDAFESCYGLTDINLPDSITSIGPAAFAACTKLKNISLPKNLKVIDSGVFSECEALQSVTVPSSVTTINSCAFNWCISLASVTIPASVTAVRDEAFGECTALKTVNYQGTKADWGKIKIGDLNSSLTSANIIFNENSKPAETTVKDENTSDFGDKCGDSVTYILDVSGTLTISGTGKMNDYTDADSPFSKNKGIKKVVIENGVSSIGENTFNGCDALTSVTIPASVTSVGSNAFTNCSSLKNIQYKGTEAQWKNIGINENNEILSNAEVHFSEAVQPAPITPAPSSGSSGNNIIILLLFVLLIAVIVSAVLLIVYFTKKNKRS